MQIDLPKRCSARELLSSLREKAPSQDAAEDVVVGVPDGCFVYPSGLTLLASTLSRAREAGAAVSFEFADGSDSAEAYFSRMNLFRHLEIEHPESFERHTAGGRFIPLMPIDGEDAAMEATDALSELVVQHFDNAREFLPALEWAVCEITDNIIIHAESPSPGFLFAQFYPEKNMLSIAITDAGRGLRQSLSESFEVDSDRHAIELATERGITRGVGQGNGVAGTRDILEANGGSFSIWSGESFLRSKWSEDDTDESFFDVGKLPGTGVGALFRTDHPVDLQQTFIEQNDWTYIDALAMRLSDGEVLRIVDNCNHFGARPPAERLRRKISALLPDLDEPLTLDFDGVDSVSSSFVDELLGKLIADIGLKEYERMVHIVNMNESIERRANVVVHQRLEEIEPQTEMKRVES